MLIRTFCVSNLFQVWYRAWFGSKRPRVRIPPLRPNKKVHPQGGLFYLHGIRDSNHQMQVFSEHLLADGSTAATPYFPQSGKATSLATRTSFAKIFSKISKKYFTNHFPSAIIPFVEQRSSNMASWCRRLARQPVTLEVDGSSPFGVAIKSQICANEEVPFLICLCSSVGRAAD